MEALEGSDASRREVDHEKVREALRQGERILLVQQQVQEAVFKRAGEILRLSVATLGGLVVVGGIMASSRLHVGRVGFTGLSLGVLLVASTGLLMAVLVSGFRRPPDFVPGPNMSATLAVSRDERRSAVAMYHSIAEAIADSIEENQDMIERIQKERSTAILMYVIGSLLLLFTLLYIIGGHMHAW